MSTSCGLPLWAAERILPLDFLPAPELERQTGSDVSGPLLISIAPSWYTLYIVPHICITGPLGTVWQSVDFDVIGTTHPHISKSPRERSCWVTVELLKQLSNTEFSSNSMTDNSFDKDNPLKQVLQLCSTLGLEVMIYLAKTQRQTVSHGSFSK